MLSHRVDTPLPGMFARQETFGYDDLDRLTTVHHGLPPGSLSMSYAANGNITGKTGLGEYSYGDGAGPHALTGVDDPDGLINSRTQTIEYNAFKKASVLIDTVGNDAYRLEIIYGPDGQRWKTALQKNGSVIKTVIFAGDYEKVTEDGVTRELIYLPGGGIYVRQAGQADKVYYAHTDHLGSTISITDGAGAEVFKASYDAWGKQTITNNTFKFHRGYTGHEHLPEFGLINMNARLYDPVIGRFLSPDPYVQAPEFSQSFNRYSYAWNNPLIYTDPDGESIILALAIISAWMGMGQAMISSDKSGWGLVGDMAKGFVVGAASGAVGAWAGGTVTGLLNFSGIAGGFLSGAAGGFAGGFVGGAGNAWAFGADFGQGLQAGLIGGGYGALAGGIIGGISGGISAHKGGYRIWNGVKFSEYVIGSGQVLEQYKQNAANYEKSSIADMYDEMLLEGMDEEFGVSVGDYNIKSISTKPHEGYGLTSDNAYVNLKTGNRVGGYARQHQKSNFSDLRISPRYAVGDIVDFRAIAGHELTHSFHIYTLGSAYIGNISEGYAYRYTYNTYLNAGYYSKAFSTMQSVIKNGYSFYQNNPAYRYPRFFKLF